MAHNGLDQSSARLLVERGSQPVDSGWQWSSDPALTLPTALYLAESQVGELLAAITCPVTVIAGDQGMLLPPLRDTRLARLQEGQLITLPGTHHLHMATPESLAPHVNAAMFSKTDDR